MYDEAVHDSLAALKLIPDWYVASKMIKNLYTALYADENILYFNEDSGKIVFNCNGMGILNIDLNNINLDNNFDEDDTIILIRLLAWHIEFEKLKELKKIYEKNFKKHIRGELMAIAWHSKRWWDWCFPEDEKKEIHPICIEAL